MTSDHLLSQYGRLERPADGSLRLLWILNRVPLFSLTWQRKSINILGSPPKPSRIDSEFNLSVRFIEKAILRFSSSFSKVQTILPKCECQAGV